MSELPKSTQSAHVPIQSAQNKPFAELALLDVRFADTGYLCVFDSKTVVASALKQGQKPLAGSVGIGIIIDEKSCRYWSEKSKAFILILDTRSYKVGSRAHPCWFDDVCARACKKEKRILVVMLDVISPQFVSMLRYLQRLKRKFGFRILLASGKSSANSSDCQALYDLLTQN